jgi:hypothetical protein
VRKRDLVDLVEALEQNIESLWRRHDEALVAVYGRITALEGELGVVGRDVRDAANGMGEVLCLMRLGPGGAELERRLAALESRSWGAPAVPAPAVEPPKQTWTGQFLRPTGGTGDPLPPGVTITCQDQE